MRVVRVHAFTSTPRTRAGTRTPRVRVRTTTQVHTHLLPFFFSFLVETVIVRIFYNARRGNTGRMSLRELRRCGFVAAIAVADAEPDINRSADVFSYEHFYVIYCKFWELDKDHDLIIDAEGLFFMHACMHTSMCA